ncbi:hypothetical protein VE02_08162 [Pseudogymnoascus sp. 03VT05]|nr:hypothetical protein VE02_08162 [Pseudogymnoascus sp. 03VT05]
MPLPNFNLPSGSTCSVKVIENGSILGNVATKAAVAPPIPGFDVLPSFPSYSFLIEGPNGRKILFDLGIRPDWRKLAPIVVNRISNQGWDLGADKHIATILEENNQDLNEIEAIILSHWHWDHMGDPSTFPASTSLVVGPGFKKAFLPGYPEWEDSPILKRDYEGRKIIEIDFAEQPSLKIGRLDAYDYFEDGSFYILNAPGHAIGHICALARTTSAPDTFVLIAADAIHHCGELRPSEYLPIPESIFPHPFNSHTDPYCPGHTLDYLQTSRGRKSEEPFLVPLLGCDVAEVVCTVEKVKEADCHENIFVIFSHDDNVKNIIDFFPADINQWRQKDWGQAAKWKFLKDFAKALDLSRR